MNWKLHGTIFLWEVLCHMRTKYCNFSSSVSSVSPLFYRFFWRRFTTIFHKSISRAKFSLFSRWCHPIFNYLTLSPIINFAHFSMQGRTKKMPGPLLPPGVSRPSLTNARVFIYLFILFIYILISFHPFIYLFIQISYEDKWAVCQWPCTIWNLDFVCHILDSRF